MARKEARASRNNGRDFPRNASVMATIFQPAAAVYAFFFLSRTRCSKAEAGKIWLPSPRENRFTGETDKAPLCSNKWWQTTKKKQMGT